MNMIKVNLLNVSEHDPFIVRALYDFEATTQGELSFLTGDIIHVTQSSDPDWWDGDLNGRVGAFPATYVERI